MIKRPLNSSPLNHTGEIFHPPELATLTKGALNTVAINSFAKSYEIEPRAVGVSRVYNSFEVGAAGNYNLVIFPVDMFGLGLRRRFNEFLLDGPGLGSWGNFPFHLSGGGYSTVTNSFDAAATGVADIYGSFISIGVGSSGISFDSFNLAGSGLAALGYDSYTTETPGAYLLAGYDSYEIAAKGSYKYYLYLSLNGSGFSRVANDLTQYELYRGVDGVIDLATPWQTFSELPFTTPALDPDHEYSFVLRNRNDFDLVSQNIEEWKIEVSDTGEEATIPPAAPVFVATAVNGGKIHVSGFYNYLADADQGDQWLIYLTSTGVDPDPVADTPIIIDMVKVVDGVAKLSHVTAAFPDDTTIKTLVRIRNSGGPVDSINVEIQTATATTQGPAAPQGDIFY